MGFYRKKTIMEPITSVVTTDQVYKTWPGSPTVPKAFMYTTKTRYRQKKPYNLNLPYNYWRAEVLSYKVGTAATNYVTMDVESAYAGQGPFIHNNTFTNNTTFTKAQRLVSDVTYKARERFIGAMKGSAGIGVGLVESKRSMDMIKKRALQLFRFSRALRRGRISDAAKILGVKNHPSYHAIAKNLSVRGQVRGAKSKHELILRRKAQKAIFTDDDRMYSNLFLEFHFGWSPLVADVYDSIDVLQREIPAGRIVGRAKEIGVALDISIPGTATHREKNYHVLNVNAVVGATVSIKNPNLALANQLGLINPATLVWEVIPFSFVIDWFVNVGDFLGSFTEFAGYSVSDPFVRVYSSDVSEFSTWNSVWDGITTTWNLTNTTMYKGSGASRVLALPGVELKVRTPWRVSPTRAATAISLLIQQFTGKH